MTKSTRTILLVLLGLCGFGCLGSAAVAFVLLRAVGDFGGSGEWSESAIPERELPAIFGVRLPTKPLKYQSRAMGFQDGYYEVLVQLPPGAADAFLRSNELVRGGEEPVDADTLDQLRALDPTVPGTLTGTALELPEALKADGGSWNLHRSAQLLEAPGVLWVHLIAYET